MPLAARLIGIRLPQVSLPSTAGRSIDLSPISRDHMALYGWMP